MLTRDTMRGLYALPPTPFDKDGTFLESAYRENLQALLKFDVDAVVSPGSNGEWWNIDEETRRRLMEALYEECHGKIIAAACTSSTYTEESIARTRWAEEIGLDAVMNVPPFYFPHTREELRRYWHDLADACPEIGLIVYNFPMVAQRLEEDLMVQLGEELPTLCGSKESHPDFNVWLKLHRTTDLAVLSAHERLWFTVYFKAGAKGIFSTGVAAVPGLVSELHAACRDGQWERATALEEELWAFVRVIESRDYLAPYNAIAQNKAVVNAAGWLEAGQCRPPLISVPDELVHRLRRDLEPVCGKWLAPARSRGVRVSR
jgi:4-hydroxy-tetrahydrodipicolinate synthase